MVVAIMPKTPDERLIRFSEDQAQRLIKFYSDTEREILAEVNKALLKGNQTRYLKAMQTNVQSILQDLRNGSRDWCEKAIPQVYLEGAKAADAQMKAMGTGVKIGFASIHQQAAQVLADSAYNRFDDVSTTIGRRVDDIYRTLALENIKGSVVGYKGWQKVARTLRNQLAEQGITGFKDAKGRQWNMKTYAEMVSRTTTMEAHLQGTSIRLQEHGHDLIKVSKHSNSCPKCLPWEGKVLSLSGKSKDHPSLQDAKDAGLFHPRCRHAYGLYINLDDEIGPEPAKAKAEPASKGVTFKTTKEAEKWAQANLGIAHVDYTNIHVTAANEINKTVYAFKQKFPQVKDTKWLSTGQRMFKAKYEAEVAKRVETLRKMGYTEEEAIKWGAKGVKKKKVPGNFYAFSTNKTWGEFEGIAISEKFAKTAKGFDDMRAGIARDIASGFHPAGVQDPSSVITHEMGHQLHYLLIETQKDRFVNNAWREFLKEVQEAPDAREASGKLLSRYATTNEKEFFAEAIMEYVHSSSPRKYAMIVGEGAENALKGL